MDNCLFQEQVREVIQSQQLFASVNYPAFPFLISTMSATLSNPSYRPLPILAIYIY